MKQHIALCASFGFCILLTGVANVAAEPITITPETPSSADIVFVNAFFGEMLVGTHSHSVDGNTVSVRLSLDGTSFLPSPPGVFTEQVGPLPQGSYTFLVDVVGSGHQPVSISLIVTQALVPQIVPTIEFYNTALDHYFISNNPDEIGDLDSGVHSGWTRTGYSFNAHNTAAVGESPVCRYYIPPGIGDSHFLTAFQFECNDIALSKYLSYSSKQFYLFESSKAFYVGVPDLHTAACPSGYAPVYRLWNQRTDSNHRYTTSRAIKSEMVAKGWIPEGLGPDAVAMCAPP